MREELWQVIRGAVKPYLSAQKQEVSEKGVCFHPAMVNNLANHDSAVSKFFDLHAGAVSSFFDLHLLDTRVPLIQAFFRGVLTVLLLSTFMPTELDAALTQSKTSDGCGILALGTS